MRNKLLAKEVQRLATEKIRVTRNTFYIFQNQPTYQKKKVIKRNTKGEEIFQVTLNSKVI